MAGTSRVAGVAVWPRQWKIENLAESKTERRFVDGMEREVRVSSNLQLSINDVPEQRYADVIKHMCDHYLVQEFICKCFGVKRYKLAIKEFRELWTYILHQRKSIGAFRVNPDGSLGELLGVDLLYVSTDAAENWIWNFRDRAKAGGVQNMLTLFNNMSLKVNIRRDYGVNNYLASMGLSVQGTTLSEFNVQEIAVHLLATRVDIGRTYNVTLSLSFFTNSEAQILGKRAGFEAIVTLKYAEILHEDRSRVFPNSGDETVQLMVKRLWRRATNK